VWDDKVRRSPNKSWELPSGLCPPSSVVSACPTPYRALFVFQSQWRVRVTCWHDLQNARGRAGGFRVHLRCTDSQITVPQGSLARTQHSKAQGPRGPWTLPPASQQQRPRAQRHVPQVAPAPTPSARSFGSKEIKRHGGTLGVPTTHQRDRRTGLLAWKERENSPEHSHCAPGGALPPSPGRVPGSEVRDSAAPSPSPPLCRATERRGPGLSGPVS
jgi:hypothetical protein